MKLQDWALVNQRLVAKAIGELSYEQVLKPQSEDGLNYELRLKSGVSYRFRAWRTIWDYLRVDTGGLVRVLSDGSIGEFCEGARFFLDIQEESGMNDITLANFLDEMHRTLYSDQAVLAAQEAAGDLLSSLTSEGLPQGLLDGHPKALLNKGRMGWGASDLQRYAPEALKSFPLLWLAVRKNCVEAGLHAQLSWKTLLLHTMSSESADRLIQAFAKNDLDFEDYMPLPVHPWQWDNVIVLQFAGAIAKGDIVSLGIHGDSYIVQTSLRTLTNEADPRRYQIKVPIAILNTSCVRGISGHYIAIAPQLSQIIQDICLGDPLLKRTLCLRDTAGLFFKHDSYHAIKGAPYRFQEFLGAIWRESAEMHLSDEDEESSLLTSALIHRDKKGQSIIASLIERSGLRIEEWLTRYFEEVVLPLYHLQVKYGVGLVSHGQNIVLRLKQGVPAGVFLKDFQGDLRILDEDIPELEVFSAEIKAKLTRLPAHYLIHDLLTGHFVTVLRFVSAVLREDLRYPEEDFYALLGSCIQSYHRKQPQLAERWSRLKLLGPTIPRLLVNKVRFQIGYGDDAARPLPILGTDLQNPLYRSLYTRGFANVEHL